MTKKKEFLLKLAYLLDEYDVELQIESMDDLIIFIDDFNCDVTINQGIINRDSLIEKANEF